MNAVYHDLSVKNFRIYDIVDRNPGADSRRTAPVNGTVRYFILGYSDGRTERHGDGSQAAEEGPGCDTGFHNGAEQRLFSCNSML